MEDRIRTILVKEYNLSVDQLSSMEGGYCPDEIYLLVTSDQMKYVVKYIRYHHSVKQLQTILEFENHLHDVYDYPCPRIIPSHRNKLIICDQDRLLFVQTFIEGLEPTKDILDQDEDDYLYRMGGLLAQWRNASRQYLSHSEMKEELTDEWWNKQNMNNVDPCLVSNFLECQEYFAHRTDTFERGLIHNDFHTNNSILGNDRKIFVIDFIDACQSVFVGDLATSLFHLLIDQHNGKHRATIFLRGYQQIIPLTLEEVDSLDKFVRLKLTISIIVDLQHSANRHDPFFQSCFRLLNELKNDPTLVKSLL